MNTKNALEFIRKNSRCVVSMQANKLADWQKNDPEYPKSIFEHRLGQNGTPFILHDFGSNGWDIYFISGGNEAAKSVRDFCVQTGCEIPSLFEQVKMK